MAYLLTGKIKEASEIVSDAVKLHPEDAQIHLFLGNIFWSALNNAVGGVPIEPFEQITLEALGCDYELAHSVAAAQYTEAMRLSRGGEARELAKQMLVSLRITDDMRGINK